MSFILQEGLGGGGTNIWTVSVTDGGLLTTTLIGPGSAGAVFLNDWAGLTWQLGVTTGGLLTTNSVGTASNQTFISLSSPSALIWYLTVNPAGLLMTALQQAFGDDSLSFLSTTGFEQRVSIF